ncbi:hypothetical protein FGB62_25g524 [Gracilaria domingensis]|nr:hypothetical protein FGB62_25g524 [Gracilaria domingensis]
MKSPGFMASVDTCGCEQIESEVLWDGAGWGGVRRGGGGGGKVVSQISCEAGKQRDVREPAERQNADWQEGRGAEKWELMGLSSADS